MEATQNDKVLVDSYLKLMLNWSLSAKLELISKLSNSLLSQENDTDQQLKKAFGGWEGDETSEELIKFLRESRNFTRTTEEF